MNTQRGFTLLEMLLALAIFSLLSLAGYQLLQGSLRVQQQSKQHTQHLGEMARLFSLFEQDLKHALILPGAVLNSQPAFIVLEDDILFQFMRRNWLNPLSEPRASIQEVRWQFANQTLFRQRLNDGTALTFSGIQHISLRFYFAGRWQDHWTSQFSFPQAVEISLTTTQWGVINRVLIVGNGK